MDAINGFFGAYRFLSNFYSAILPLDEWVDGVVAISYPTVEHAYQASKFQDLDIRREISQCDSPKTAKRLAWRYTPRKDWDDIKLSVMDYWLRHKFSQRHMMEMLLNTGDAMLYETNNWGDRYWGVDEKGNGENHLGRLLMEIRDQLRQTIGQDESYG